MTVKTTTETLPRVWLACLACYFEDWYCGHWDSFREYAEHTADDTGSAGP